MSKAFEEELDEALVVAAILGDLEAFNELASRYRAAVVRTAQAIVGRQDAEDVAQEAILRAFKALPTIEDPARFAAWLGVVTRNCALRFGARERALRVGQLELDDLLLEKLGALDKPILDDGVHKELSLALENVPFDYSLALRLRFLDEMPLNRIASFLGVSMATVKWRIHRGKQLLREQIENLRSRGEKWKEIRKS